MSAYVISFELHGNNDLKQISLLHNAIHMAKTFFKFISVNSRVDIINPVMIGCGDDINNYN